MKLSNKILIGFFGFAFIYLTAVFAEIRFRGTPNKLSDDNSMAETVDMSGVSVVVLQNIDRHINVVGSNEPRLEVRSLAGDLLKNFSYRISGDTLILSQLQSTETKAVRITIFSPTAGFQKLIVNSAGVSVTGLKQEILHLSQHEGRMWISDSQIAKIEVEASERSYLQIESSELDSLSARMDFAEMYVVSPVRVLRGSMENASSLRMVNVMEIQFKKDASSRFNLY